MGRAAIPSLYSPSSSIGNGAQSDIQNANIKLVREVKTDSSAIDDSQSDNQRLNSPSDDQINDLADDVFTSYNRFEVLSVEEDIAECKEEKTFEVMEETEQVKYCKDLSLYFVC